MGLGVGLDQIMAVALDAGICEDEETCEKGSDSESEMEEYVKAPIG